MFCESMDEDLSEGSMSNTVKNNQFTSADDYAPKARKPYTITKQRERWTEEEHKRFLEALRLHGRAWRRIEEHVGTKTAVQIRSHAQKFFSKVVRESTSGDGSELKPIEIPPPRPKRKPAHPYPRKLSAPIKTGGQRERSTSPNSSGSEQENRSPTSVLSAGGSNIFRLGDSGSPVTGSSPVSPSNGVKSDPSPEENETSQPMKLESYGEEKESSPEVEVGSTYTQSLKLFGKTVVINDGRPTDDMERCDGNFVTYMPQNLMPVVTYIQFLEECSGSPTSTAPWWGQHQGVFYPATQPCNLVKPTTQSSLEMLNEGSFTSSNMCDAESGVKEEKEKKPFLLVASERSAFTKQCRVDVNKKDECSKGFVPYKRCIEPREIRSIGEEKEEESLSLNL